ncbi:hypothetical protein U9M48_028782 [Paspalum notatum var. saurae]|uniref:Uncharacterized protein n=1 Tax=Paspalum notatum var. saurae TaxID=547442 RepID=A0AAQ3X0X4_PASNO
MRPPSTHAATVTCTPPIASPDSTTASHSYPPQSPQRPTALSELRRRRAHQQRLRLRTTQVPLTGVQVGLQPEPKELRRGEPARWAPVGAPRPPAYRATVAAGSRHGNRREKGRHVDVERIREGKRSPLLSGGRGRVRSSRGRRQS